MEMQFAEHEVLRKSGRLRFSGVLLASVSSRRPMASRWAELALYRLGTVDGRISHDPSFVLTRVGHSRVYHQDVCPEISHHLPFGHELVEQVDVSELVPCQTCAPSRVKAFDEPDFASTHRFEITKYNASVCRDVDDLLVRLMPPPRRTMPPPRRASVGESPGPDAASLPWLSMNLLTAAAEGDHEIAERCTTEVRI